MFEDISNRIIIWLSDSGFKILLILFLSAIGFLISKYIAIKIEKRAQDDDPSFDTEEEKRAKTMAKIFLNTSRVFIGVVALLMIIGEFGIDIGPLLAGAGIAGIAIGLGAKDIVGDVLAGFFILLEQRVRVGDIVKIGNVAGLVEKITMRTIILRDLYGVLHIVPNGKIDVVSNMTYEWSRAVLKVGVAYTEDIQQVIEVIEEVGKKLRGDPELGKFILEDPMVLGVDELGDSSVVVLTLVKTSPRQQWAIEREYRKRVKIRFDELGIEIPLPQRVVTMRNNEK